MMAARADSGLSAAGPGQVTESAVWRDSVICLSFANLCFVNLLDVTDDSWRLYFVRTLPTASLGDRIWPITATILMFGAFLLVLLRMLRRTGNGKVFQTARWIALAATLMPLNILRGFVWKVSVGASVGELYWRMGPLLFGVLVIAAGVAAAWAVVRWRNHILRFPVVLALIAAPLFPLNLLTALYSFSVHPPAADFADLPNAPFLPVARTGSKVIWLIFDEFDQHWAFEARPPSLDLPELDRFRKTSIYATHALPPGPATRISMPALITGRLIQEVKSSQPNELWIRYRDSNSWVAWSQQENVFHRARRLGVNSGLSGFWNPYGRVIARSLNQSFWSNSILRPVPDPESRDVRFYFFRLQLAFIPVWPTIYKKFKPDPLPFVPDLNRAVGARMSAAMLSDSETIGENGRRMLQDSRIRFVMIHWPQPHPPGFYDAKKRILSSSSSKGYFDNLALVDDTFGKLRRTLEESGEWDDATVLVSSDHPLRAGMREGARFSEEETRMIGSRQFPHIPFLLKLKGQNELVEFDEPFNTVISGKLLLGVLAGNITTPAEALKVLRGQPTS